MKEKEKEDEERFKMKKEMIHKQYLPMNIE